MSVKISAECKQLDYTGAKRAVLLELADHANDDGICWPSRARLMYNTGLSESAVKQQVRELREDGVVSVESNREGGRGRVPIYKIHPLKGPQKIPFNEWCELHQKGSNPAERGQPVSERGQILPKRGHQLTPEPSVNSQEPSMSTDGASSRKRGEKKTPLTTQYVMDSIYDALKAGSFRLSKDEYAYNLGRVKNMLENDSPTEEELAALPGACVEYFEWYGKLDVALALRRHRQQEKRRKREASGGGRKVAEKTVESPDPISVEEVEAMTFGS